MENSILYVDGEISYVEVYDKALSDDEINSISEKVDSNSDFTEIRTKAL